MEILSFYTPEKATKNLQVQTVGEQRRLVISTNMLRMFGYVPGALTEEINNGAGAGFQIRLLENAERGKKVYEREYKHRKNNPCETLLDVRRKDLLEEAIPAECESVHITFEHGLITVNPVTSHQARAIKNAKSAKERYSAFVGLSSGIDAAHMVQDGFVIHSLLEKRVLEARDKTDITETGILTAMHNVPIGTVYNEDIYDVDPVRIAKACEDNPYTVAVFSPQCDDFSNVKSNSAKVKSVENLDSTKDMILPVLDIIKQTASPTVVIENVPGFVKSDVFEIFQLQMRRLGYKELTDVYDARDFGGLTSRKRAYAMYSCLPCPLEAPIKTDATTTAGAIGLKYLSQMRDITDNISIQKGIEGGRLRSFNADSEFCPTFLKSQSRMAKDTVTFEHEGRHYFPTNEMMAELMGIDNSFEAVSKTIESEQIGQSVEVPLSRAIMCSIKNHLNAFFGGDSNKQKKQAVINAAKPKVSCPESKAIKALVTDTALGDNYQFAF